MKQKNRTTDIWTQGIVSNNMQTKNVINKRTHKFQKADGSYLKYLVKLRAELRKF
jgi:hypothetical protein